MRRSICRWLAILATFATLAFVPFAGAQAVNQTDSADIGAPGPDAAISGAPQASQPAVEPSGLPAREPQARTMRAYSHVFIAFAVAWVLLFGFALSVGRRFGRLEEEVRRLER